MGKNVKGYKGKRIWQLGVVGRWDWLRVGMRKVRKKKKKKKKRMWEEHGTPQVPMQEYGEKNKTSVCQMSRLSESRL